MNRTGADGVHPTSTELVRASVAAFLSQDRDAAARLLADDFAFSSPQDDRLDKPTYLEHCFPTAHRFADHAILDVVDIDGERVLLRYEYELTSGDRYRNTEHVTVRGGRLVQVEVYFGPQV